MNNIKKVIFIIISILIFFGCKKETIEGSIITASVTDIEKTSATCGGSIQIDRKKYREAGIVWSEISDKPVINSDIHTKIDNYNNSFSVIMTNLKPDTKYFVRAYMTVYMSYHNRKITVYGKTEEFETKN
jgi:hypothetical protein